MLTPKGKPLPMAVIFHKIWSDLNEAWACWMVGSNAFSFLSVISILISRDSNHSKAIVVSSDFSTEGGERWQARPVSPLKSPLPPALRVGTNEVGIVIIVCSTKVTDFVSDRYSNQTSRPRIEAINKSKVTVKVFRKILHFDDGHLKVFFHDKHFEELVSCSCLQ